MDNLPKWVLPATLPLVRRMANQVRKEHRREIRQCSGLAVERAVQLSFHASVESYALVPPGWCVPIFVMGVEPASILTGQSMVWMIGTDDIQRFPVAVVRAARWGLQRAWARTGATVLDQYIPAWYRTGIRFAETLGFVAESSSSIVWQSGLCLHMVCRKKTPRACKSLLKGE